MENNCKKTYGKQDIYDYLNKLGYDYEVIEHQAVHNMEELSEINLPHLETIAKNLFVCDEKKRNYYLITTKGDKRVDLKDFRCKYGLSPLSLAKEEKLKEILGIMPGSVTPLSILNDNEHKTHFFIDEDFLMPPSIIGIHPNENTATIWLKVENLLHIIKGHGNTVEIASF